MEMERESVEAVLTRYGLSFTSIVEIAPNRSAIQHIPYWCCFFSYSIIHWIIGIRI